MIKRREIVISKWEKTLVGGKEFDDDIEVRLDKETLFLDIYIGKCFVSSTNLNKLVNLPALKYCIEELKDEIIKEKKLNEL